LSSGVYGPSVLSSGVYGPSVLSSGVYGPSVLNSGVYGPSVLSSRVYGPSVLSSGVYGPSVLSSRLVAPSVYSSGVVGPSVLSSRLVGSPVLSSGLVGPSVYSSGVVGPSVYSSGVVGPSVLSSRVTVARPAAVAVERVSYGSVPSVQVVNEPTTIVQAGRPIRGHSFSSEVRHDSQAPVAFAAPAVAPLAVSAPLVSAQAQLIPSVSSYSVGYPSVVGSNAQVLATGPTSIVASPALVSGYSRETGRTDLLSQVRLRAASVPAQIVQDTVVQSAPLVASPVYSSVAAPAVLNGWENQQLVTSDWKK